MPLISVVGRRSLSARLLLAGMYLLLSLGALSMLYPFALMIATATASQADAEEFELVPRYWLDRDALFKKYLVDVAPASDLAVWFDQESWLLASDIEPRQLRQWRASISQAERRAMAGDWRDFVAGGDCPDEFRMPLFNARLRRFENDASPVDLADDYQRWLKRRYDGSLALANGAYDDQAADWDELIMPAEQLNRMPDASRRSQEYRRFLAEQPPQRAGIVNFDVIAYEFALTTYGNLRQLQEKTGFDAPATLTSIGFDDIARGALGPEAREAFLRNHVPLRFVRIDPTLGAAQWRAFLAERNEDPAMVLAERMPVETLYAATWAAFAQKQCPLDAIEVLRPETRWRAFLRQRYHDDIGALNLAHQTRYGAFEDVRISHALAVVQYDAFENDRARLGWKYALHNFIAVLQFIAVHGDAAWVTLAYVVLLIATTLTVNPLAAYALSRFRLPQTYQVLVFLLVPMAFPAEVLMIPSFLMIKSFPLGGILLAALSVLAFALLRRALGRRMSLLPSATLALAITAVLTGWALPRLAASWDVKTSVSLMNTFWALILPGLASGFGIFLLKGFFDSLPPELYEAARIDGAGELRMFWQITLPLSKPILAVLALGAFTAGYGSFMHAFLVCQDPRMWTLMVFLYEFQQTHGIAMVMASLVLAAVPTLLVFVFCQNIILRGIVIPSFK